MTSALEQVKAWSAPVLVVALLGLALYVWQSQQARIAELEVQANATSNALATITANQGSSLADRAAFQQATSTRLDKMQDTLASVGESLAALTALQRVAQGK